MLFLLTLKRLGDGVNWIFPKMYHLEGGRRPAYLSLLILS